MTTTATTTGPAVSQQDDSSTSGNGPSCVDRLVAARAAAAAKRAQGTAVAYRDPIERAAARPTSLKLAIAAKCWSCAGAGQDPGTRQTIGSCSVLGCPLHRHRPYQRTDDAPRRDADTEFPTNTDDGDAE